MSRGNRIIQEDMEFIFNKLTPEEKQKFKDSTILITGCGGFLGYYFMHFFNYYSETLNFKKIIALDNFLTGTKDWLDDLSRENERIHLHNFNVITDDLANIEESSDVDFVIHGASIASPIFYRIYPIETIDANVTGLRRIFDHYKGKDIKGLLFFSSSEIYGDPFPEFIPTSEDYRGNVATMGPRACYDEAKRFGETLCYYYYHQHGLPVSIARPFNNFGPGMNINDRRLPADFAKYVLEESDLTIYSDGSPTRTFCYVADAIAGYLKVLAHGTLDVFNIGTDTPEISVRRFAEVFVEKAAKIFNYQGKVVFNQSNDKEYMTDNPNRRCPNISKAKKTLNYNPSILVDEGVERYLEFLKINKGQLV